MWKAVASNALSLFVVVLFLAGGLITWGVQQYSAPGPLAEAICLRVPSGGTMRVVSQNLSDQGAISSTAIYNIGSDYSGRADLLKAGAYLVPEGASMEQIVDIVTRGGQSTCGTEVVWRVGLNRLMAEVRSLDPATARFVELAAFDPTVEAAPEAYTQARAQADTRYRIAVAEGLTSWQVVEEMKSIDLLEGDVETVPPEGMLAPDSYEVVAGATRTGLIERMQSAQAAILAQAWAERADGLPYASPQEALTMASIVEKETGVAEERPLVASVFVNRLEQGMRLQTDPTVIYGITDGQGVLGRGLRQSELRRETPYNTYVINGLPPGPIANPGRAAIEAALNPAQTDFIFFVADGSGGHAFATTLEEHNRNVEHWREVEAQAAADAAEDAGSEGDGQ